MIGSYVISLKAIDECGTERIIKDCQEYEWLETETRAGLRRYYLVNDSRPFLETVHRVDDDHFMTRNGVKLTRKFD